MATLKKLTTAIQSVIQDDSYSDLTDRINDAVNNIAGGVRMPDETTSPPLPDLYSTATASTTTEAYADLPADYQRGVFLVVDSIGDQFLPVRGGGYYSFKLFLKHCYKKDLTETGSVERVCVKGKKLYYQGIPSTSVDLLVSYYKKPTEMSGNTDEPDGIPDHLQMRLIKHYVCKEIFGEGLEDGATAHGTGTKYHTGKFYEAMTDLIDFIGTDDEPEYYGYDDGYDDCIIGY